MLEITVCMTVLKGLLGKEIISATKEEQDLAQKLFQHKLILSPELNQCYMDYCDKNNIDKEQLQQFLAKIVGNKEQSRILDEAEQHNRFEKEPNPYLRALKNASYDSKDRILISEHSKLNRSILHADKIELIRKDEMEIEKRRNLFTKYTFPIIAYQIKKDEDCKELSEWIGRILEQERSFIIYDNYFADSESIKNFKKYILKYMSKGSDILIKTAETDTMKKADIVSAVAAQDYSDWNVEVYLVKSKKDSHPRAIITPTYSIYLDRGISTFGRHGKTFSSLLTIKKNKDWNNYRQQTGEKIFP